MPQAVNFPQDGRRFLSDFMKLTKYAKALLERTPDGYVIRECWDETVSRSEAMMMKRFPQWTDDIHEAYNAVRRGDILPSMRCLQFGGEAIEKHENRIYNCCFTSIKAFKDIRDAFFNGLCGTGVGFSVQEHHVACLPVGGFTSDGSLPNEWWVEDSIEGWADALLHLLEAWGNREAEPLFQYGLIRPKGSLLRTTGGTAPGPEPLKEALEKIAALLRKVQGRKLRPLEVHDIICHSANAVFAGGVRRSALISLFSPSDDEMLTCKMTPDWYQNERQRERANNSAVIHVSEDGPDVFWKVWSHVIASPSGCPGVFFTHDRELGTNPCTEASLVNGGFCNLEVVSARGISSVEEFIRRSRLAARIGTLQASFTNFSYLQPKWKAAAEADALLGLSITGIGMGTLDNLPLRAAAEAVLAENSLWAHRIGINPAARTTLIKPEGSTSLTLGVPFGISGWYDQWFKRRVTLFHDEPGYKYLKEVAPQLLEEDSFDANKAYFVIPVNAAAEPGFHRSTESSFEMMNRIERYYKDWVIPGHRSGLNTHTISCTVNVKPHEWGKAGQWLYDRRKVVRALSVYPEFNAVHKHPPYESISEAECRRMCEDLPQDLDFRLMKELSPPAWGQEAACGGGFCEIS